MKHYELVEFLSNLNVKPPAQTQSPPIDDFLATVMNAYFVFTPPSAAIEKH